MNLQRHRVLSVCALLASLWLNAPAPAHAADSGGGLGVLLDNKATSVGARDTFLPVEQAFRVSAEALAPDQVRVTWVIAPGYYLYQKRLKFALADGQPATLGPPQLPKGLDHTDEFFGTQTVYREILQVSLGVARAGQAAQALTLNVGYQGCADAGLCYPPQTSTLKLNLPAGPGAGTALIAAPGSGASAGASGGSAGNGYVSEQDRRAEVIRSGSWLAMLSSFYVAGLLVAFTGCVLPTIPILSGLIVGAGNVTTLRAFMLSLTYVLGMAVTYTAAGAITAASGLQVQALFQKSWVTLLFAGLFVLMAASMFGAYTLQMPSAIQTRLTQLSNRQRGGTWTGVAVMGALSALIVTACVAPAMIAALAVISQTGDVLRGASALFVMSLGMGTPLLVVGASAGRLLPRAGSWMDDIKRLAGCTMLGVAAWMLARLVTDSQALLLFAVPALAAGWVLWRFAVRGNVRLVTRIAAAVCVLYAGLLGWGSLRGATDPLHPLLAHAADSGPRFAAVRTVAELDARVRAATTAGKGVMLDFYADWCVSCKEMERYTFSDPAVAKLMDRTVLLRADVTANDADDQALLKRFAIVGPPTIAFYDTQGNELPRFRVVGYMKAPEFAELLRQWIGASPSPNSTTVAAIVPQAKQ